MIQYDPKNTFNIISNKIINSVEVLNSFNCEYKNCNNDKLDESGNCTVCGYTNDLIQDSLDELEISIIRLNEYFKNGINRTYNFLDKLYSIKDMNINFVNSFLIKLDYENIRNKELELFKTKFKDNELTKEELRRLESLIITKEKIEFEDMDILTRMVFNKTISKNTFAKYVILFNEFFARENNIYLNSVKYGKIQGNNAAETKGFDITYDLDTINKIYDLDESDSVFFLMYHELYHVKQNNDLKNKVINLNTCKYAYDSIIRDMEEDFYKENYNLINQEIDADIMAYIYTKRLKDKYSIDYPENILKQQIKTQLELSNIGERKLGNYIISYHDLVLKSLIKNPNYLKQYPQLQVEFKIVNGIVLRKERKELEEEINIYNDKKNELLELKQLYKIDNFKELFINSQTKDIIKNKGITYDGFLKDSNINKIRLSVIEYYDSINKKDITTKKNNRGYSNASILSLSMIAIVLLIIFIVLIMLVR